MVNKFYLMLHKHLILHYQCTIVNSNPSSRAYAGLRIICFAYDPIHVPIRRQKADNPLLIPYMPGGGISIH